LKAEDIQTKLKTKFIGKELKYYKTLESTHILAKSLEEQDISNGMIIFADSQTGGIGTHQRKWFTGQAENLSFNIILLPDCDMRKFEKLTIIIAECLVYTIKKLYNVELFIKKHNDVILNNKKLAGILTETVAIGNTIKKLYIGIGININQIDFPGNLKDIATSLKKEFQKDFDRIEIFSEFLEVFEKRYIDIIK